MNYPHPWMPDGWSHDPRERYPWWSPIVVNLPMIVLAVGLWIYIIFGMN